MGLKCACRFTDGTAATSYLQGEKEKMKRKEDNEEKREAQSEDQ